MVVKKTRRISSRGKWLKSGRLPARAKWCTQCVFVICQSLLLFQGSFFHVSHLQILHAKNPYVVNPKELRTNAVMIFSVTWKVNAAMFKMKKCFNIRHTHVFLLPPKI